jgi:hypothetical protein
MVHLSADCLGDIQQIDGPYDTKQVKEALDFASYALYHRLYAFTGKS